MERHDEEKPERGGIEGCKSPVAEVREQLN